MKFFEEPIVEVLTLAVADIVTTSGDEEMPPLDGNLIGNCI